MIILIFKDFIIIIIINCFLCLFEDLCFLLSSYVNLRKCFFVCLFVFYGISTFVGYLMSNPFLYK